MRAAATAPELDHPVRFRGRHWVVSALRSSGREPQRIRYYPVNLVAREGDGMGNANGPLPRPEMRSHTADAWYLRNGVRVRYELIFIHHFDEPQSLRRLEEIRADISALETGTEGQPGETVGGGV